MANIVKTLTRHRVCLNTVQMAKRLFLSYANSEGTFQPAQSYQGSYCPLADSSNASYVNIPI